ncbi:methylmalonyl-CoA mutase family protein [Rhodohalobacter mucosus]|uniref:Methylmalonyl-CoA mutase alpha/beta chain catalytic domain-containing protein n=1 Tax=Rhodohalobacter mucosus TaxID=2079485 RepID=A0A316TLY5_9BACT|nr:methylmalonyl-CoA mutase family protein [Rhodohalobacter mucosus]PWN05593.1 hypothetical protein DDZ15_13420 [Rhodohalobacter mucosus]
MKNIQTEEKLFSDFPTVSRKEWEEKITSDLGGADYTEKLKWETLEGLEPLPFYMREDVQSPPSLPSGKGWTYCEPVFGLHPAEIRDSIASAYSRGARTFLLTSRPRPANGSENIHLHGSNIPDQDAFDGIFEEMNTEEISLFVDAGISAPVFSAMTRNHPKPFRKATFIFDPITESAAAGKTLWSSQDQLKNFVRSADSLAADALFYHKAGCTIVSEAAIAISLASEYFSMLEPENRESAAASFLIRVSAGPLYFPEIAKFRALRILWKNLLDAYGMDPSIPAFIHAETTFQNKTISDPHNNMLRATAEAMAAVTGGADSLVVFPYDISFRTPDTFSRRIAGNVHHILGEEAHLGKTGDPSAGAYYIENLTQDIAQKAWTLFTESESRGGLLHDLMSGSLQQKIRESRSVKQNAYATRRRVLTGTNNYPDTGKELPDVSEGGHPFPVQTLAPSSARLRVGSENPGAELQHLLKEGKSLPELILSMIPRETSSIESIKEFHAGDIFDSIRKETEELAEKTGIQPDVLILPVGNLKWRNARASFAQNLLGCAGFRINMADGGDSLEDAVDKLEDKKFDAVVLCGSDKEYPDLVPLFCERMGDRPLLVVAGHPGTNEPLYRDAGIDEFIWAGMNAAGFLRKVQSELFKKYTVS